MRICRNCWPAAAHCCQTGRCDLSPPFMPIRMSTTAVRTAIADVLDVLGGEIQSGELALREDRPGGRAIGQALCQMVQLRRSGFQHFIEADACCHRQIEAV